PDLGHESHYRRGRLVDDRSGHLAHYGESEVHQFHPKERGPLHSPAGLFRRGNPSRHLSYADRPEQLLRRPPLYRPEPAGGVLFLGPYRPALPRSPHLLAEALLAVCLLHSIGRVRTFGPSRARALLDRRVRRALYDVQYLPSGQVSLRRRLRAHPRKK